MKLILCVINCLWVWQEDSVMLNHTASNNNRKYKFAIA